MNNAGRSANCPTNPPSSTSTTQTTFTKPRPPCTSNTSRETLFRLTGRARPPTLSKRILVNSSKNENIEYSPSRNLDKALISRLSSCVYVLEANNVIILGATGVGKTYLASALGMAANRSFYAVRYIRLPDLLAELAISRGDGTYRKVMKKYKQIKLLILDEYLLFPLKESEARDLLEIVEARHKVASTIFCSQFAVAGWYAKIGEPTLSDAICDRIVHNSYTIKIDGDSMRKRKSISE